MTAPTLWARLSESGRLHLVWCPYCRREHQHGVEAPGHRIEHCAQPSRFPHGYILEPRLDKSRAEIRAHNEQVVLS